MVKLREDSTVCSDPTIRDTVFTIPPPYKGSVFWPFYLRRSSDHGPVKLLLLLLIGMILNFDFLDREIFIKEHL